jgi:hypothetical protein
MTNDCQTCRFYEPQVDDDGETGQCRRYAPKPLVSRGVDGFTEQAEAYWPIVLCDEWCGEWQFSSVHDTGGRKNGYTLEPESKV